MHQFTTLLFLFFYLLSTSGVAVNVHYCAGKISSVSLAFESKKNCGCDSKKTNRNCCKDKKHFYKVEDSHKLNPDLKLCYKSYIQENCLFDLALRYKTVGNLSNTFSLPSSKAPPGLNQTLHIKNRILRI